MNTNFTSHCLSFSLLFLPSFFHFFHVTAAFAFAYEDYIVDLKLLATALFDVTFIRTKRNVAR